MNITIKDVVGAQGTVDEAAVRAEYETITQTLIKERLTITTMESCTSGQVASLITDTEGSSAVLHGAYVTYQNEATWIPTTLTACLARCTLRCQPRRGSRGFTAPFRCSRPAMPTSSTWQT